MPGRRPSSRQGFALILVLWVLGVLALLIAGLTAAARTELRLAEDLHANAQCEATADGAIDHAVFQLRLGAWSADGTVHHVAIGGAIANIAIEDLGGRIDPNFASPELLSALMTSIGIEPSRAMILARRLVDWRSPLPFSLEGGSRLTLYQQLGLPYGPPGRPFTSIDELGLVPGMSAETLERLRPFLSVYHGTGARTAPRPTADTIASVTGMVRPTENIKTGIGTADKVVRIQVVAHGPGRARFVRTAVVRIAEQPLSGRDAWQILVWE